jgi:hypothetical protein
MSIASPVCPQYFGVILTMISGFSNFGAQQMPADQFNCKKAIARLMRSKFYYQLPLE